MKYIEIKAALADADLTNDTMFSILRAISRQVNNRETHQQGRDLVIRALARIDRCGTIEKQALMSLVRNVGLFPYMSDELEHAQEDDFLAYELHRPDNMTEVFHSLQAKIYYQLRAGSNVVLSAATSVGKSLIIDAMIALGKFKKIVIVVPTLALIDETRKRLAAKFRGTCHLITHPSQTASSTKVNVYILTQERVRHRIDLSNIDFFVVDEFYKLDIKRAEDNDRSIELNLAFHKLASTGAQFYLLGPNVQAIRGLDRYEVHFIPSEFSTVSVDLSHFNLPTKGYERRDKLLELCDTLTGPTLIYCQSPPSASRVANALIRRDAVQTTAPTVEQTAAWVVENFHPAWIVGTALKHGIGLHHGGIPRALQQHTVRLFNDRKIRFLICTSTLIEGVNTAAENVIIYDRRRNRNVLDFFTYKNIQGRAGRMGRYFVGKVFVLEKPPQDDDFVVDYPVAMQDSQTPLPLLMQLDEGALTEYSRLRVSQELEESLLSEDTIRANGAVPPQVQNAIAQELLDDRSLAMALSWKGFPSRKELPAVCNLIVKHLSGPALRNYGIVSGESLAWHLNAFSFGKGVKGYLKRVADGIPSGKDLSDEIDRALRIVRNVVSFSFPRDLRVLDRIQAEILPKLKLKAGDFSVYAESVENLFLPGTLSALEEYGLPIQIVQRIQAHLEPAYDLDEVIDRLRSFDPLGAPLTGFERELITEVQQYL